jgi:SAM-dependent methyltransferase
VETSVIETQAQEPSVADLYDEAELYDRIMAPPHLAEEVEYYATVAKAFGNSVLEIGCGTGRLSLPLARRGLSVTGVDVSPHMLAKARAKVTEGQQVRFLQGDARSLDTGRQFDAIIIPYNTLGHFHSRGDLVRLFARVRSQLTDTGAFAIDIANPRPEFMQGRPQPCHRGRIMLGSGAEADVTEAFEYDDATQVQHRVLHVRGSGAEKRLTLDTRLFFPQELDTMLHFSGLNVIAKFGTFLATPFVSQSMHQLVVCAKAPDFCGRP